MRATTTASLVSVLAGLASAQTCAAVGTELIQNGNFEASKTNIAPWSWPDDDSNAPLKGPIVAGYKSKQAFGWNVTTDQITDNADFARDISQPVALCNGGLYLLTFDRFQDFVEQYYYFSLAVGNRFNIIPPRVQPAWTSYKLWFTAQDTNTTLSTSSGLYDSSATERLNYGLDNVSLKRLSAFPAPAAGAPNLLTKTGPYVGNDISWNQTFTTKVGSTYVYSFKYTIRLGGSTAFGNINTYVRSEDANEGKGGQINYGKGFGAPTTETSTFTIPFVATSTSTTIIFYYNSGCVPPGIPFPFPCVRTFNANTFSVRLAA